MRSRMKSIFLAVLTLALCSAVLTPAAAGAQVATTCNGKKATIVGTNGADILRGTPKADVIVGNGGADQIFGAGGNDIICGNAGADLMQGGPGKDIIIGGFGDDRAVGGPGNDTLLGGPGNDVLLGKTGNDIIKGEAGADDIVGNLGTDTCTTVSLLDNFVTGCEKGNSVTKRGTGDGVALLKVPTGFKIARHCFTKNNCDNYYAASVELDGTGSFDSLGIQAFDAAGNSIATYSGVGDTYGGSFLFKGKPARIEVDSGGGAWRITFVNSFGVPSKKAAASGWGNKVYRVSNKNKAFTNVTATWRGYGNFAVIGVSPARGRDLMVNEVRFAGNGTPPFTATATAQTGISVVGVLAQGSWSVRLGK